ncbi:MAG: penicillin-binding protein activator [Pseudomonadota bacterium]
MIEDRVVRKLITIFSKPRLCAVGLAALVAACGGGVEVPTAPSIVAQGPLPQEERVIGDGSVTIAMLLPITAGGSASGLAQAFQNAAELALDEVETDSVRIVVRDTGGETDKARAAAEASVTGGAQLILGPVFAPAVSGAAVATRSATVPLIGFSTDASLAGRGVYLLSFLPRQDATRIVQYASEQGIRSFAGLVPDNGYGLVMEAAFREAVAARGGRVTTVERYAPGEIDGAVSRLSAAGAFQALFVPNGGDDPAAAAAALASRGVNTRLLGSGQWDNPAVLSAQGLSGAWFPGPREGSFQNFARRYQQKYGAEPPRTASLVYDAALLANGLVGARGGAAFSNRSLENAEGFVGVDGIFRLRSNGLSERGLAVYEATGGGNARTVSAAPTNFDRSF